MFCRNCGKEIPNGINFCNHCGATQNNSSTQDTQSAYQANEAQYSSMDSQSASVEPCPPKRKRKGPFRFIIPIAVVIVAFVVGYFVTGANKLKQPTTFDTPSSVEFDDLESTSVKQNTADGSSATEEIQCKTFVMYGDAGRVYAKFFYGNDGVVKTVSGAVTCYDTTNVDADYLDNLRKDAETANDILREMGVDDSSFVIVTDNSDGHEYNETYEFAHLEEYTGVADLAAEFIGFETENGRITIDLAEEAMLGMGFTLQ